MGRRLTSTLILALSLCSSGWAQNADAPAAPKLRDALRSAELPPGLDTDQAQLDADAAEEQMHSLLQHSGRAFAGQVLAIARLPYAVEIRFRVEVPVRNVHAGEIVVLHEWIGLWNSGEQRYTPGERVLVFLNGVSSAGYASPVGGQQGIVPLHGDAQNGTLDLRWIAAHARRTGAALTRILPRPFQSEQDALMPVETSTLMAEGFPAPQGDAAPAAIRLSGTGNLPAPENPAISHAPGTLVFGMLSSWERAAQSPVREFAQ